MARQNINIGTSANDGTGDTLRAAGEKINDNFGELYFKLGGDSDTLSNQISLTVGSIVFEGSTADSFETSLLVTDPTADRTVTIPDATGTIVFEDHAATLTNKTLTSPVITTPQFNDTSLDHQYVLTPAELTGDRNINLPLLTDSDTFVFAAHNQTLTNKTLTAPTITNPVVSSRINDANGAEIIIISPTGSAVNEFTLANAATGNAPSIIASGGDTNVDVHVEGKGSGSVRMNKMAMKSETITANGTADDEVMFHICNKGTALAVTLDDGLIVGEISSFVNKGAGDATITPTNFAPGTSVTIQQNEAAQFFWDGSNWFLLASYNGTLNP